MKEDDEAKKHDSREDAAVADKDDEVFELDEEAHIKLENQALSPQEPSLSPSLPRLLARVGEGDQSTIVNRTDHCPSLWTCNRSCFNLECGLHTPRLRLWSNHQWGLLRFAVNLSRT